MSDNQNLNERIINTELDEAVLKNNLSRIAYTMDKGYLSHLEDYSVWKFNEYCKSRGIEYKDNKNYMAVKVCRFIINKQEKVIDCMKNVIGAFSASSDSLGFVVHRKIDCVDLYFVFKKDGEIKRSYVYEKLTLLKNSLVGNFAGAKTIAIDMDSEINREFSYLDKATHITMLSAIPSDKSEDFISQGIEKLLNGVVPESKDKEYTVIVLAESVPQEAIRDIISGFEDMATAITPYASHQFQIGKNDSEQKGEMKSSTDTKGISRAISKTHSINVGVNAGNSFGHSNGTSDSVFNSSSVTHDGSSIGGGLGSIVGGAIGSIVPGFGTCVGAIVGRTIGGFAGSLIGSHTSSSGFSNSVFESVSKTLSLGFSGGYGYSWGKINTDSESNALTEGTNNSITIGNQENTTFNYKSYQVADLIQNLELTIKRLNQSKSTGLWKTATYVLSEDNDTSLRVANYLRGLTQGDESFTESAAVKSWSYNSKKENSSFTEIRNYITHFIHPIFVNSNDLYFNTKKKDLIDSAIEEIKANTELNDVKKNTAIAEIEKAITQQSCGVEIIPITPTTNISTTELAKIFSLPTHALPGLPVLECAEFGRTVASYDETETLDGRNYAVNLGKIWHMNQEERLSVSLNLNSLASNTFITGSTGAGKSNTVYKMLSECRRVGVKFLVVEPAKGEYKNVFGNDSAVKVYGTNPALTPLLRINPFSFPHGNEDEAKNIHILEHLDRLIEIFNVCWPMYAAMPAVLKEAVEKSYEDCGWNLTESTNSYGGDLYPTFADVARNIRVIIDSSEYDAENKGAYKGSLITRLKSLTNGINGLIFTTDEIPTEQLFDENVIVDLSRVGSSETKALIMGLLVLKLQEHRMTSGVMNANLRHVTVLEEAHNLLKRTSTEQSQESANLLGKSVEMLTNSIAEMRTYGEGFIIADQAPALLDMAVIRNTNTKIIMRLPDQADRELVGKAANLNDDQITELAKLPCGVAAVYQNEWVQAVLCKVGYLKTDKSKYSYSPAQNKNCENTLKSRITMVQYLCQFANDSEKVKEFRTMLDATMKHKASCSFSGSVYAATLQYLDLTARKPDYNKLSFIVSSMLPELSKTLKDSALKNPSKVEIWRNDLQEHIEDILSDLHMKEETNLRNNILQCVLQNYILSEINKPNLLNELLHKKN